MALLANINRDSKKRKKPYTAQDFSWDQQKKEMTDDEIYNKLRDALGPDKIKQRKQN